MPSRALDLTTPCVHSAWSIHFANQTFDNDIIEFYRPIGLRSIEMLVGSSGVFETVFSIVFSLL